MAPERSSTKPEGISIKSKRGCIKLEVTSTKPERNSIKSEMNSTIRMLELANTYKLELLSRVSTEVTLP